MHDGGGYVKRPLLLVGAAFFVTIWFLTNFGQKWFFITAPLVLSLIGFSLVFVWKTRALVILVTFLSVTTAYACYYIAQNKFLSVSEKLSGTDKIVVGQVYGKQSYDYGSECVIKLESVDGVETDCKMKVKFKYIPPEKLELYEQVTFRADVSDVNSKSVSKANSLKSSGIYLLGKCYMEDVVVRQNSENGIIDLVNKVRKRICSAITDFLPNDNGGLIVALTLGDKSNLSYGVIRAFRICGLSHLMAVSGLHVYTWAYALFVGLISLTSKRKAAMVSMAFTLFFMALANFTPSVVRAGVMMTFLLLGFVFLKVPDSLNSMGASLILICIANPFAVNSVSLQLSFSAALGLSLMNKKISSIDIDFGRFRKTGSLMLFVCRSLAVCITVSLFTLPVMAFTFGEISLIGIVGNLLCVTISMYAMIIGGIAAALSVFGLTKFVGTPLLLAAGFMSKIIIAVVNFLSGFDFLYINIDYIRVKICVAVLAAAAMLIFLFKPNLYKNKPVIILTAVNLIFVSLLAVNTVLLVRR